MLGSSPANDSCLMCQGSLLVSHLILPPTHVATDALVMKPTSVPCTLVRVLEWKLPSSVTGHLIDMASLANTTSFQIALKRGSPVERRLALAVLTRPAASAVTLTVEINSRRLTRDMVAPFPGNH